MSLFMFKSVLTSVVLLLAIGEAFSGMRLRGYFKRVPLPLQRVRLWHRVGGDVTLALTTVVGLICLWRIGASFHFLHVTGHAVLGTLAGLAMIVKVVMARGYRRALRHALRIGAVAGFSVLGTFVLSSLWYFFLEL
jgi:hypothetical protein